MKSRRVALIYDAKLPYDVKVIEGVAAYLHANGHCWNIFIEENALQDQRLPELGGWEGSGIIADFDDAKVARQVLRSGIPAVGFGSGFGWYNPSGRIPYFYSDNEEVACLAVEHLLERGFRHFAYYGYRKGPITGFSAARAEAFARRVRLAGGRLWTHLGPYADHRRWMLLQRQLRSWLESLPKPVGLMAANDKAARHVLEACRASGIRVPEEMAVVGVDNDEMLCRLCDPPLSSVEQGARRIGYQAAKLLEYIMSGRACSRQRHVVPPEGVVVRRSSEVIAVEDPNVRAALTFIREHARHAIKVVDVAAAAAASRSKLERDFQRVLRRTIHDEIRRARLEEVRRLVTTTRQPLKQIAAQSGFRTVQHMTEVFRRFVGVTPAAYRVQVQEPRPLL